MKKENIRVDVFNWGPCVIKLKVSDWLVKTLLKEGKNNRIDFTDKLAGIIENETGYSDKSKKIVLPELSQYLGVYDQVYQNYVKQPYEKKPEYILTSMWINHQRPYEYNPPHDHDGKLSFVIYLQIPKELKEEQKKYKGKSCGPGGIQFIYGDNSPRDAITFMSLFPEVGDMFIFPSWLKHWVAPYKSDCLRVSVSGNFHDNVPLNNVVDFAPSYIQSKKLNNSEKNNKYNYLEGKQVTDPDTGKRVYEISNYRLPSVTTILGATKDQTFLKDWKAKVGTQEAERIKNISSSRGTSMHKYLESFITDVGYDDLTELGQAAKPMAEKIMEVGLAPVDQYFGSEVTLHYPGLYAGQTDLVCLHNDIETIVDFKQANRPKKKEWIEDYYLQIAAYAMAHDYVYGSSIRQGVIMVCTPDLYYQEFRITDHELRTFKHKFLKRLDMYHDLIFDEKEKTTPMKEEDFTNG